MIHKIGGWIRWRFSEFPTPFEISRERERIIEIVRGE